MTNHHRGKNGRFARKAAASEEVQRRFPGEAPRPASYLQPSDDDDRPDSGVVVVALALVATITAAAGIIWLVILAASHIGAGA